MNFKYAVPKGTVEIKKMKLKAVLMNFRRFTSILIFFITFFACPQAFSATYVYDNANRLISIDHGDGTIINYTYDANGNLTSTTVIASDLTPPTGSIIINGGGTATVSTSVSLALSASDFGGAVAEMRVSNDNSTWSTWEPYATTKAWTLSGGTGTKTVYVQFKDQSENISLSYSDNIDLVASGIDLTVNSIFAPAATPAGTSITVNYSIQNIGSSASAQSALKFYLTTDPASPSPSDTLIYQTTIDPIAGGSSFAGAADVMIYSSLGAGTYYIRAQADAANTNLELNEYNNSRVTSPIQVSAASIDLTLENFSAPSIAETGSSIYLNATLRNLGTSRSLESVIKFFVGTDPQPGRVGTAHHQDRPQMTMHVQL